MNVVPTAVWQSVASSQTGAIQAAIEINQVGSGSIYLSQDSGSNWSPILQKVNGWQSISISSSGQYITAIQAGNSTSPKGNIWISPDYGTTCSSNQQIYSYVPMVNGFLNLDMFFF